MMLNLICETESRENRPVHDEPGEIAANDCIAWSCARFAKRNPGAGFGNRQNCRRKTGKFRR